MPGSPYLEQAPKGLLTWPKLLKIGIPTISVLTLVSWWNGVLLELGIVITIGLVISFVVRR